MEITKQLIISEHHREIGKKGGIARAKVLTSEQIKAIGKKGGIASGKARAKK